MANKKCGKKRKTVRKNPNRRAQKVYYERDQRSASSEISDMTKPIMGLAMAGAGATMALGIGSAFANAFKK